jgi:UDP-MurNAc hydroxylase
MKIQFIGHAGFIVESASEILIMDPWLSETGAFDSAWFQFPCNHHLAREVVERIQNPDKPCYLYVSHEHKDHFDVPFLKTIVQHQPITIVAHFSDPHFMTTLREIGFSHINALEDGKTISLNDLTVTIYIDDGSINRDSAILVKEDDFAFLNLNDCKIFDRLHHIRQTSGPINVIAGQFSGASWHPTCYRYDEKEYVRVSRQKSFGKLRSVLNAIETVQPDWYFPCAGPPCFLDPDLMHLNFEEVNIFPSQFTAVEYLKRRTTSRVDAIMPGDVFDSEVNEFSHRSEERVTPATERDGLRQYAARFEHLWDAKSRSRSREQKYRIMSRLADELNRKLANFVAQDAFGRNIYFSLTDLEDVYLCADFVQRKVYRTSKLPNDKFYHVEAPAWQIERVLDRAMTWEDFCLTFRAKVARSPDKYDTLVNGFLFSEFDAIPELIDKITGFRNRKERVVVEVGGQQWEIDRYCPHQGADLSYGWCEGDRYWVCSRHRWKFDIENGGRCLTSSDTINVLSLEAES